MVQVKKKAKYGNVMHSSQFVTVSASDNMVSSGIV